ncbi:hypothetical protein DL93DRAFT_1230442 [Clavulina sp. PMI_390]|nr:hypothetical protein DL93DRAFT_1230442 [Clavulina sp. PMI_390]
MVRPRLGHFVYTADEIATMKEDIGVFKSMGVGVAGVVFGVLTNEGRVNVHQAKELAEAAAPLQVTFHRAFDVTRDLDEAFDDIARVPGITRILTRQAIAYVCIAKLIGSTELNGPSIVLAEVPSRHRPPCQS